MLSLSLSTNIVRSAAPEVVFDGDNIDLALRPAKSFIRSRTLSSS